MKPRTLILVPFAPDPFPFAFPLNFSKVGNHLAGIGGHQPGNRADRDGLPDEPHRPVAHPEVAPARVEGVDLPVVSAVHCLEARPDIGRRAWGATVHSKLVFRICPDAARPPAADRQDAERSWQADPTQVQWLEVVVDARRQVAHGIYLRYL